VSISRLFVAVKTSTRFLITSAAARNYALRCGIARIDEHGVVHRCRN
jgi:hypothetical protein